MGKREEALGKIGKGQEESGKGRVREGDNP